MRRKVEAFVKNTLHRVGVEIRYDRKEEENNSLYNDVLNGAIAVKKPLNIIQVGANDGRYKDPIYDFVRRHKDDTTIVLIEPQEGLIPYLEENYSYHPSTVVWNKAIGSEMDRLTLYKIKEEFWTDIDAGYGEDWPNYRVATGVTTSDKRQLLEWVSEHVQVDREPSEIIECSDVEVVQPHSILEKSGDMDEVCLLQVDTEGMDDQVVYSFFDDEIYPGIINIEREHLTNNAKKEYEKRLSGLGYDIYDYTPRETLALRTGEDSRI